MYSSKSKLAVPLALLTAVGMLSSDLYLPALPAMAREIGAGVVQAQATMAVYLLALAVSQLGWGWAADRFGDRITILAGIWLLIGGSLLCALAPNVEIMLLGRLLQGLGSGAATVAVPALIRRRFSESEAVGALSIVATLESVVPAAGPVLGVALLKVASWRVSFVLIALAAFVLLFFASRIVGAGGNQSAPGADAIHGAGFSGAFLRHCAAYACMFGALLMFVASAPHLVTHWFGESINAFAVLQVCGVLAFMLGARRASRVAGIVGVEVLVRRGTLWLGAAAAVMVACAAVDLRSIATVTLAWAMFCYGLGVRGPSSMSRALSLVAGAHGKAAGVLMFSAFAATALATMAVAPFLHLGLWPVALLLAVLVGASAALVPELMVRARARGAQLG